MQSNLLAFKNLLALLFTVWFGYVAWSSRGVPFLARVFPLYIGVCLFVLGIINLVLQIRRVAKDTDSGGSGFADLSTDWNIEIEVVWQRFFVFMGMILAVYAAIAIIGYPVALTLFIFFFYRFVAGASWRASAIGGLAGLCFLALTSHLLNMEWPEGLITLPWPLG